MKRLHLFSLEMMDVKSDRFPLILSLLDAFNFQKQHFIDHSKTLIFICAFGNFGSVKFS